jgi:hypothetical protein
LRRFILSEFFWRFFRRAFTGIVLIYVAISWLLGETPMARPVYYVLAGLWTTFQLGWYWHFDIQNSLFDIRRLFFSRKYRISNKEFRMSRGVHARRGVVLFELIAFNLALTLFLAEYSLRFYGSWSGRSPLVADTIDTYKLVPGHDYGGGLRGNNLGYPGKDFQKEKRAGIRRLAALGDSFAVGPAVPFADNFLTLLEGRLSDVEVYNFGISSTGPREYQAVLQEDVWQFQPDIIVVCVFVGNDITESLATPHGMSIRKSALYQFLTRAGRLARERARQPVLSIASSADQFPRPPLADQTFREIEARRLLVCQIPPPAGMEKKWQSALSHLRQIVTESQRKQVPVGLVLIPDELQVDTAVLAAALQDANLCYEEVDLDLPQRRLRDFCADQGVPCLDLKPFFDDVPDAYAFRDTHWNVRGNRLAAEKMAAWILQFMKN